MDSIGIGSATYILREECKKDLMGVFERLAGAGFDGVELLGFFGVEPADIRKGADKAGLKIMGNHVPYDEFIANTKRVIEEHVILGTRYIAIDRIPEKRLPGSEGFGDAVNIIEEIGQSCKEAGMQLLYHNHGYDLIKKVDGKHRLEVFLDSISPEYLSFLPDLGWVKLGGGDPVYFLEKYADRCPVIHLKDYYASGPVILGNPIGLTDKRGGKELMDFEFRPTGYGVMNYPGIFDKVLACKPKWIVPDHDLAYERDSIDDLKDSVDYLKNLMLYTQK